METTNRILFNTENKPDYAWGTLEFSKFSQSPHHTHTRTHSQMVDSKRRSLEEAAQQKREERNKTELKNWENRFSFRETEARLKEDEDRLRDLSVSSRHMYAYSREFHSPVFGNLWLVILPLVC